MPRGRHAARAGAPAGPGRLVVLVLGALVLLGSAGTWAYWSDSATITGGAFESGSMDLQVDGGAVGTGTGITITSISASDLTPGEYQSFGLSLANVGSPPLTWTAQAVRGTTWTYVDSPLIVQLFAGVAVDDATYPRVDTCSGAALGAVVPLASVAADLTSAARSLVAGATTPVCLRVGMASTAGNANQGATGTIQLTFEAAQVTE